MQIKLNPENHTDYGTSSALKEYFQYTVRNPVGSKYYK